MSDVNMEELAALPPRERAAMIVMHRELELVRHFAGRPPWADEVIAGPFAVNQEDHFESYLWLAKNYHRAMSLKERTALFEECLSPESGWPRWISECIALPGSYAGLARDAGGHPVGFLLGRLINPPWCRQQTDAYAMVLWVESQARGQSAGKLLVHDFEAWSRVRNATHVHAGLGHGMESWAGSHKGTAAFLKRQGYRREEETFIKKLEVT